MKANSHLRPIILQIPTTINHLSKTLNQVTLRYLPKNLVLMLQTVVFIICIIISTNVNFLPLTSIGFTMEKEADHLPNVHIRIRIRWKISELQFPPLDSKNDRTLPITRDLDTCQQEISIRNIFSDNNCRASVTLSPIRMKK